MTGSSFRLMTETVTDSVANGPEHEVWDCDKKTRDRTRMFEIASFAFPK